MERSYNFPYRSAFSTQSRQNIGSKRPTGLTPFMKSSRFSTSGRSAQSVQIILKSQGNYVERFGQPLPVLITEALTFAERNTIVSARISECGFAWVVCGRRLLVWQYRQNSNIQTGTPQRKQTGTSQCYELQLPQSDLAHRAELVSVYLTSGSNIASCIAVSPEGVVRYWSAVAHETVYVEMSVDLQGQECDSITSIDGLGSILATTTCTVVLVQPQLHGVRHSLTCSPLKIPSGWLGGISKRMSSLIFGPISSDQSAETRLVRVLSVPISENTWTVYVLAGHSLQKWRLSINEPEQLIFAAELNRLVREGFYSTVWENCAGDRLVSLMTEADTWLLDIQADKESVIILAAAVNLQISPQIHYALICLQNNSKTAPTSFRDFAVIKLNGYYREDNPADGLSYRLLLCNNSAYLYNQKSITVIRPQEEPDTLEFNSPHDFLLGGSICVNTPVFFSRNHGLVSVSNNEFGADLNVSLNMTNAGTSADVSICEGVDGNLTLYDLDPEEMYTACKDTVGQLKAAFIYYLKKEQNACQDILHELFLMPGAMTAGANCVLDKVVIEVCKDFIDDIPANDPRWSDNVQSGLGSSYSMQIFKQLQDKKKALSLFFQFLKENVLWNKLTAVTVRDNVMNTTHVLGELSEKVTAAITLKNIPVKDLLNKAIVRTVENPDEQLVNGLTHQDIFYREVTKVYRVLQELVNICDEAAHSDLNPSDAAQLISEANDILINVLKEVVQYRQQTAEFFHASSHNITTEYLPWTSAAGPEGLYDTLILQQPLCYNYGVKVTSDKTLCGILYDQLVYLVDIILDGRKCHVESVKGTDREEILFRQYQADRHNLIKPLIADKDWERAALLAEKYLDFETLVIICEATNNQHRLEEYTDRFSIEGFSEYLYSWYIQENKQGKLMDKCRTFEKTKCTLRLSHFLSDHPSLSWMQNIFDKNFDKAANTLKTLADNEIESVTRQKTMLSLGKLARLANIGTNGEDNFVETINADLELIGYQEDLPDYVLELYGYDTLKPRVISAKDLIHLYICPDYKDSNEIDFKKALDLLAFIKDEEQKTELNLLIWKNAILKDTWKDTNLDSPLDVLQNKLLFKIADLAIVLGTDPHTLLPPLDALTEDSDIMKLQENKGFQFLLKTAYEHVNTL